MKKRMVAVGLAAVLAISAAACAAPEQREASDSPMSSGTVKSDIEDLHQRIEELFLEIEAGNTTEETRKELETVLEELRQKYEERGDSGEIPEELRDEIEEFEKSIRDGAGDSE